MGGRRKRKNSSSSPQSKNEVKKSRDSTTNNPPPISSDVANQVTVQSTTQNIPSGSAMSKSCKPIFVNASIQIVKNLLKAIRLESQPICKIRGANSTNVTFPSLVDKKNFIGELIARQLPYHTFTDVPDKPLYYLLKGFYHTSCEDMLTILSGSGIPAVKVSYFINKVDHAVYIVHFQSPISIHMLSHLHRVVDGIAIRWEMFKKSEKKVTQCFRCQQWGHAASNCGRPVRCVKCNDSHPQGECTRKSREGSPTCCNCGGSHAANFRGCPSYVQHLEKTKSRTGKTSVNPVSHRTQTQLNIQSQFPALDSQVTNPDIIVSDPNVSFCSLFKESSSSNHFKKISEAQSKLLALPNISETINLFVLMVEELAKVNDHYSRCLILAKYCIPSNFSNES